MATTRRKFTEEEDRVILSKVSENPGNIAQCLRELSDELGNGKNFNRYKEVLGL